MIARYQWVPVNVTDVDGRTYRLELSNRPGHFRMVDGNGKGFDIPDDSAYRRWGHLIPHVADSSG